MTEKWFADTDPLDPPHSLSEGNLACLLRSNNVTENFTTAEDGSQPDTSDAASCSKESDTSSDATCSEERVNDLLDAEKWFPVERDHTSELAIRGLLRIVSGKLLIAEPTIQTRRVLELNCGNGFWTELFARECLDQGLSVEVTGTDLTKPTTLLPWNCNYVLANIATDSMGSPQTLDIIVSIANNGRVQDWRGLCEEAFRCLRPYGCIEFQGFDFSFQYASKPSFSDQVLKNHFELLGRVAFHMAGTDLCPMSKLEKILPAAGFQVDQHIIRRLYATPQSKDQKEVDSSQLLRYYLASSLRSLSYRLLTQKLGWAESQVEDHLQEVDQAIWAPDLTVYVELQWLVARRGFNNSMTRLALTPSLATDEDTNISFESSSCE